MFKTATAAAVILAALSSGAFAQVTMKKGQYLTATTFTSTNDAAGICAGLGVIAGATNYGVYTVGTAVSGVSPVTLVNTQPSSTTTAGVTTYSLSATTCTLPGWPALSTNIASPTSLTGDATCNGGVYKLKQIGANTAASLTAAGTAFSTSSNVAIEIQGATPTIICSIAVTSVGSFTGS